MFAVVFGLLFSVVGIFGQQTLVGPYSLVPSGLSYGSQYGFALAFGPPTGNLYLAVGAPSPYYGVSAVYGWQRLSQGMWLLTDQITPPDNAISFGSAIAFAGTFLAVGAPQVGNVYIYARNASGQWSWTTTLGLGNGYGSSLAATVTDGNVFLAVGSNSASAVALFTYQGGVWSQAPSLNTLMSNFGVTLAFGGPYDLLVGVPQFNNSQGAVVHFNYTNGIWFNMGTLVSPSPQVNAQFGVGIFGDPSVPRWLIGSSGTSSPVQIVGVNGGSLAFVGSIASSDGLSNYFGYAASSDSSSSLTVIGAPTDSTDATYSGAAYVYTGGTFLQKVFSPVVATYQYFGYSVSVSRQVFAVGAPFVSIYGGAGAVYVYELASGSPNNTVPVPPAPPLSPPTPSPVPPPFPPPLTPPFTPSTPTAPTRPSFIFFSEAMSLLIQTPPWILFLTFGLTLVV